MYALSVAACRDTPSCAGSGAGRNRWKRCEPASTVLLFAFAFVYVRSSSASCSDASSKSSSSIEMESELSRAS
jgi:hypothetical protein